MELTLENIMGCAPYCTSDGCFFSGAQRVLSSLRGLIGSSTISLTGSTRRSLTGTERDFRARITLPCSTAAPLPTPSNLRLPRQTGKCPRYLSQARIEEKQAILTLLL